MTWRRWGYGDALFNPLGAVGLEALRDAPDFLVRKNDGPAGRKRDRVELGERFELLRPDERKA